MLSDQIACGACNPRPRAVSIHLRKYHLHCSYYLGGNYCLLKLMIINWSNYMVSHLDHGDHLYTTYNAYNKLCNLFIFFDFHINFNVCSYIPNCA